MKISMYYICYVVNTIKIILKTKYCVRLGILLTYSNVLYSIPLCLIYVFILF